MSDELVEAVQVTESPTVLQQKSITDYCAAIIAEQIESLRKTAYGLDRQYENNVRGRKIKFRDRVSYLSLREKVASKIVALVECLHRLRSTDVPGVEPGGAPSWDPDDDGSPSISKAAQ